MPKHPQRFWLAALIVAWSIDFLFWGKAPGISFLVFALLTLLAAFGLAWSEKEKPARLSYLLGGLVVILAGVTFLRSEPLTRVLNALLALFALGLLILTFRSGAWVSYRLVNYLEGGLELFLSGLIRGVGLHLAPPDEGDGTRKTLWTKSLPVLRGLLLALPVVLVLGGLLASADLVFEGELRNLFQSINLERLPEYLFRLGYILFFTYIFVGWLAQTVYPKRQLPGAAATGESATPAGEIEPALLQTTQKQNSGVRFLGSTEAFIVLGSVDLLFAFFVGIQFRYFFGGEANINVGGYTYADYARRGFGELVTVAVLSLGLYLLLNTITRREKTAQARVFTGLSVLLVGLVCVMLVSAFQRLLLYEAAYGFTSLRTYTHIFIPWLAFLLLATIGLQILRREQFFGALLLFTIFVFVLTFGVMNVDGFIADQNIARAKGEWELDSAYLVGLSDDALPALVKAYNQPGQSPSVHDTLGGVLACRAYIISHEKPKSWQSYHLGSTLGRQALAGLNLSQHQVVQSGGDTYTNSASGKVINCYASRSID